MKSPHYGGLGRDDGGHCHSNRIRAHDVRGGISPRDFYAYELPDMPHPKGGSWRDGGLCPFHSDEHKGNFRVNVDTGAFLCFACEARGGDVIAFIMQRDGIGFVQAMRHLAEAWGLSDD